MGESRTPTSQVDPERIRQVDEFERLVDQLDDPDEDKVVNTAHALGDLGDPRAVPILIKLLESTDNRLIRNAAAVGLRELADPRALEPLLRLIRDPEKLDGTLLYGLETLDARAAVVDLARFIRDE